MSKHTPGPWMKTTENKGAIPEHFRPLVVTNRSGDRVVARLPDGWSEEDRANAVLIAAAPDMLAACEEVLNEVAAGCDLSDETCKLIEAVIAKVEGRTP